MPLPFIAQAALAVAPSLISGVFANKSAKDQRAQDEIDQENKFVDLRAAAEKGGFNPLTALQATGGAGFGAGSLSSGTPPLASIQAISNGLTEFGNVVTGQAELDRATQEAQLDVLQSQSQGYRNPAASAASSVGGSTPSFSVGPSGPVAVPSVRNASQSGPSLTPQVVSPTSTADRVNPVNGFEIVRPLTAEEAGSDDAKPTIGNVREDYVVGDNVVSVPVGPDIDEMLMGAAIEGVGRTSHFRRVFAETGPVPAIRGAAQVFGGIARTLVAGADTVTSKAMGLNRGDYEVDPYQTPRRGNTWQ